MSRIEHIRARPATFASLQLAAVRPPVDLGDLEHRVNRWSKSSLAKDVGAKAVILETHKNWIIRSPVASFQLSAELMRANL
jgi:hypothetical protein